jgi:hypothetical protein
MESGTTASVATPYDTQKTGMSITCTDANGGIPSDTRVGTWYKGKIYMNYTETDTNITRIAIGTYDNRYAA